ncbi:MAG: shikimate dehydrogenase [Nitrospirae bacterium]|nr:shikimate dehydrogenase [Nitrospirota bacterium]
MYFEGQVNISGKTKIVGLFGYPVEHSLSPVMHNAAFANFDMDYCYVTFLVKPDLLGKAVDSIRALDLKGVNVTIPHKEKVIPFLDNVSEEASFIGAVNTICNEDGRLTGFNTDGRGFMQSLAEAGIDVKGKRVLVVGAGGASRAIGYYLCTTASEVCLYDAAAEKAEQLALHLNSLKGNAGVIDSATFKKAAFISGLDIVINATPLGLKHDDPVPVDASLLNNKHTVCDLIYRETPLLRMASERGCRTLSGLGMLLWQGIFAFELWTGKMPPVEVMRNALLSV